MLISYSYGELGQIFYENNGQVIPRIGELVFFDEVDYANCPKIWDVVDGEMIYTDKYVIDTIEAECFKVANVYYFISDNCTHVYVDLVDAECADKDYNDYLENLAKDVNIPNDYNR